jgi:hypothetical protein
MKITVIQSAVIDAPIDRVWAVLRDFNSQGLWHPAVARSRMENDVGGDVVGASSTRPYLYLTTWPRFASSR